MSVPLIVAHGATPPPTPAAMPDRHQKLKEASEQLEAGFLAEMLKAAGFGAPRDAFGGGIGEDQFTCFLREAQAREMVRAGGIGLAQSLFEAMKEQDNGTTPDR